MQRLKINKFQKAFLVLWSAVFVVLLVAFGYLYTSSEGKEFRADVHIKSATPLESSLDSKSKSSDTNPKEKTSDSIDSSAPHTSDMDSMPKQNLESNLYHYHAKIAFKNGAYRALERIASISILESNLFENSKPKPSITHFDFKADRSSFSFDAPKGFDTQNLYIIYQVHFMPSFLAILAGAFVGGILVFFGIWGLCGYMRDFFTSLPPKRDSSDTSKPLMPKDKAFLLASFVLCSGICIFTFWLGFPGFHIIGDTYNSITLAKDNSHPVFIAYVLEMLYGIFGKHLYYLFLFNIIPFYVGIFFLIAGFYLRFRSYFAILLIFPTFIGNIYFQNFIEYHSFALPMMLFCGYAMVLFMILAKPQSKITQWILYSCIFIIFFCAILWRHNAIFSVFLVCFVLVYMYLQNRSLESRAFTIAYIQLIIISAIVSLGVVIGIPKILTKGVAYPANHPFLHQIAGACVPNDDATCFKDEWYYPHKSFDDVKKLYEKYPLNADPFNVPWGYDEERPFKHEKLQGLYKQWIQSITKYPSDFIAHELRFIQAMWIQDPNGWIMDSKRLQTKASHPWHKSVVEGFPQNEQSITLSPTKERIYGFLYQHRFTLNHIYGVAISGAIMLISAVLLCFARLRNTLLVFSFATGFAGFFSAFFIAIFSPVPEIRYMSPILPLALMALIGFVAFVIDIYKRKPKSSTTF